MNSAPPREHLLVVSDMHLTEEKPPHGLWKRFLQRDRFVDGDFAAWLSRMRNQIADPICLVLNGDIFDFDAVMALPEDARDLSYLERTRTLHPTEPKSAFKMSRIVADHPVFFDALREFVEAGHRLVIVLGNHDVELFWPEAQARIRERLGPMAAGDALRFEPWFYQHGEVRIEHGHLLDPWCSVADPVCPVVDVPGGERHVQIPFGNVASRYLINRMGYFNSNCAESYQRSALGYIVFWVRHHLFKLRPLVTAWIAGAFYTLLHAFRMRRSRPVRPAARLPAPYEPPVYRSWFLMARELWFDRLAMFGALAAIVGALALAFGPGWWLLPAGAGAVALVAVWDLSVRRFVERSDAWLGRMHDAAARVARQSGARVLVLGHSHHWRKEALPEGGYYLNSGHFSPSYFDIECNVPVPHNRTFLWLPPGAEPQVLEWRAGGPVRLA
jgi:UDP-2,3-diacylglucosamine pyrophosphatase LpxH